MGYYPNLESREDLFEELNIWINTWKNKLGYPTKRVSLWLEEKKQHMQKSCMRKLVYMVQELKFNTAKSNFKPESLTEGQITDTLKPCKEIWPLPKGQVEATKNLRGVVWLSLYLKRTAQKLERPFTRQKTRWPVLEW